jgi:predicted dehydrogenase
VTSARARIQAGELGELVGIQTRFLWAAEKLEGWRASPENGGGVLPDLASHHIDLVLAMTQDRIVRVGCRTRDLRSPEDTAILEVVTARGVPAQILVSFAAGAQVNEVQLAGRKAALSVDLLDARARRPRRPPGRLARVNRALRALEELHPARLARSPGYEPTFASSLEIFLRAARAGRRERPTPEDGLHVLEVIDAARRSARAGGVPLVVAEADPVGRLG